MLKSSGRALTYSSDAALNQALGNFGGALGSALGAYIKQPEPLEPYDPFKTKSNLERIGLSKEYTDQLSLQDLQNIYNNQSKYLGKLSEYDSLIEGYNEFNKSQNISQEAQLSPIQKLIKAQNPQERKNVLSEVLQSTESKTQQGTFSNVLKGLLTGNALSNFGQDTQDSDSIASTIIKGAQSGTGGKLIAFGKGEGYEDFLKRTGLKGEPSFAKKLTYDLSGMIADLPINASAATVGMAGGPLASAAATYAIPQAINTSLTEYMKYVDKGGKGTLGDFLSSAATVVKDTAKAAVLGPFVKYVNQLKLVKNIPGLDKILGLKGKNATEAFLNTATQAGVLTGGISALQGEFPSSENYSKNLSTLLGFKLFGAGKDSVFTNFYKNAKANGQSPQQSADTIKQIAVNNNLNPAVSKDLIKLRDKVDNFVKYGPAEETQKLSPAQEAFTRLKNSQAKGTAIVTPQEATDVFADQIPAEISPIIATKAKSIKTSAPIKEMIKKVKDTDKGVYTEDKNAQSISETAQAIADRPVDKYLDFQLEKEIQQNKPLTVKEQAKRELAADLAEDLNKKLNVLTTQLETVNDSLNTAAIAPSNKNNFLDKKAELENKIAVTTRNLKDANDIATKGKKYQSNEEIDKQAEKRVSMLLENALNPESDSAIATKEDFNKDNSYINKLSEIVGKGEIPIKKINDYHIDTLQRYNDKYTSMIEKVTEDLKTADKNEVANLNAFKKLLEKNTKINQAKIDLQKDKINVLENLKGAKGALIKQKLKEYRSEISQLQKDFVKAKKIETAIEAKTNKAFFEKINRPEVKAKLEKIIELKDAKEAAKILNIPQKNMQEIIDNTQNFANKIIKDANTFTKSDSNEKINSKEQEAQANKKTKTILDNIANYFNSLSPKLAYVAKTALSVAIQLGSKLAFGRKIPQNILNRIFRADSAGNTGSSAGNNIAKAAILTTGINYLSGFIKKYWKSSNEKMYAKRLKNAKTYMERIKILDELNAKGYGTSAKNRIKKLAA